MAAGMVLSLALIVGGQLTQIWQLRGAAPARSSLLRGSVVTILLPDVKPVTASAPPPPAQPAPKAPAKSTGSTSKKAVAAAPAVPPPTEIASASACPNQSNLAQYSSVLLCMTNWARHFHGYSNVSTNAILTSAAAAKANDIVTCDDFSHIACGHAFDYWITQKGYGGNCSGENIARGQSTPGAVFTAWMNSSGHRANILNPDYADLGASEQSSSHGPVWVMELGGC